MTRKQAMKELKMMGEQYGLTLDEDCHALADLNGRDSYLSYIVCQDCAADYEHRRATVRVTVRVTVRRMGGEGLTPDELWDLKCLVENARGFLTDLQAHPIQFTEKW